MSFLLADRREGPTHLLMMPLDREPWHPSCLADIDHFSNAIDISPYTRRSPGSARNCCKPWTGATAGIASPVS
jgi:hypothetical protein